jgi:hypothetical protein
MNPVYRERKDPLSNSTAVEQGEKRGAARLTI